MLGDVCVKASVLGFVAWMALPCAASAQGPALASAAASQGYAEFVGQSAFGNVTSQSYGAEVGFKVAANLQIFAEAGRVTNAAPSALGVNAATIAGALTVASGNTVAYQAKEPITFGDAGVRYLFPASDKIQPYVLVGGGMARVQKNVTFNVGGSDVTANLTQAPYFTVLGTDLSGTETKAMLTVGGGVGWNVASHLVIDLQYRYGRVFTSEGINVSRAGAGIGVRF